MKAEKTRKYIETIMSSGIIKGIQNLPAVTNEIEELERKASAHDEVLKITTDYTVGKIDAQQSIIKIADLLDAWVV